MPEYLRLSGFFRNYQLNSVTSHCGDTPQSGHYFIQVRNGPDWLTIDDACCFSQQLQLKEGYLFAYNGMI
jgi:hypothetical protein